MLCIHCNEPMLVMILQYITSIWERRKEERCINIYQGQNENSSIMILNPSNSTLERRQMIITFLLIMEAFNTYIYLWTWYNIVSLFSDLHRITILLRQDDLYNTLTVITEDLFCSRDCKTSDCYIIIFLSLPSITSCTSNRI